MDGTILTGCTAHGGTKRSTLCSACRPAGECHPGSVRACAICVASAQTDHGAQLRTHEPSRSSAMMPEPTCAGPPGRARACRVLCGPLGSYSLPVPSPYSIPTLLFTTLLDARSLRRLRARHSPSFFLSASSLFSPLPSPSVPSLSSVWAAKMRWFRRREERATLTVARVLRDVENTTTTKAKSIMISRYICIEYSAFSITDHDKCKLVDVNLRKNVIDNVSLRAKSTTKDRDL